MTLTELLTRASPLPWREDDDHNIASGTGDEYQTVADPRCMAPAGNEARIEANAALIQHAVNHLPVILESLEWITRCPKADGPHGTTVYFIAEEHMEKAKVLVAEAQQLVDAGKED